MRRLPHKGFAALWLGWFANVLGALAMPELPLYGLAVLVMFLPIEIAAVMWKSGSRDTLSEIMTWAQRSLSRHTEFARGWNALLLIVTLLITFLLGRTIYHYSGIFVLGALTTILATVWLYDHWVSPDVHG